MRIDVSKYLFIGATGSKETFFQDAQKLGTVEFIGMPKANGISAEIDAIIKAIRILRAHPISQEQTHKIEHHISITHSILNLKDELNEKEELLIHLHEQHELLQPFGNFKKKDLEALQTDSHKKIKLYFGKSTKNFLKQFKSLLLIHTHEDVDYFVHIGNEIIADPDLIEVTYDKDIQEIIQEIQETEDRIHQIVHELKSMTCHYEMLHEALVSHINSSQLVLAKQATKQELSSQVFFIEGWVPDSKIRSVMRLAETHNILIEKVRIENSDYIPTHLENRRTSRIGEDVISIFDTPSATDKDPSLWVLYFFALFFAMIVGDAGYGLLFLSAGIYATIKIRKKTALIRRICSLVLILGGFCIAWGGLIHSVFGIKLSEDNLIRKHSLLTKLIEKKAHYHFKRKDTVFEEWQKKYPELSTVTTSHEFAFYHPSKDPNNTPISDYLADKIMLELALFVGSIHIILGLLRYVVKNPSGIGWIIFIIGGYLYLPNYLKTVSLIHYIFGVPKEETATFGLHCIYAGLAISTIISLIQNGIKGIFELMNSVQVFSDILSYLRIYALGLAGSIVSSIISTSASSLPLILGILIMIIAHSLNILLAIMGGVIHGLRLNFLEWYHYSFEGGGKKFRPLELRVYEK